MQSVNLPVFFFSLAGFFIPGLQAKKKTSHFNKHSLKFENTFMK